MSAGHTLRVTPEHDVLLLGEATFLLRVLDPEHAAARTAFRRGFQDDNMERFV